VFRAYKIPPLVLFATVIGIAVAQLAEGTEFYYAAMMAVILLSIGVIYNMLEGLSTLSGMSFAAMALRWVVISQIAKIVLLQPAGKYLDHAELTVSVYAVFMVSLVAGVFFYRHVHVRLPPVLEPATAAHSTLLYAIALPIGIVGEVIYNIYNTVYSAENQNTTQYNSSRSLGLALTAFVLFSLVIAIDTRIRKTNGRHSFGVAAFIPWAFATVAGFINTQREVILEPTLLYFLACYFRRYRFRPRHFIALGCVLASFNLFISPLELYTRVSIRGADLQDRIYTSFHTLMNARWDQVQEAAEAAPLLNTDEGADYYDLPGTKVLSRLSEIRMDSNLIAACASYHYGFNAIRIDLLEDIPRFIDKKKPDYGSADYLGRVAGVTGDLVIHSEPNFSMVGDSFGAFAWLGVVVVPLIVLPLTWRLYESMFDISRPWGTIALASCVMLMPEGGVGRLVAILMLRLPIYLLVASWSVGIITRLIPTRGDNSPLSVATAPLPAEPEAAPAD
jgi:hypothetical protein